LTATATGTLEVAEAVEVPVIEFVSPLPGFPVDKHFVLVRLDDTGVLYAMSSVEHEDLRFLVVPPGPFFPDYTPEIDDESLVALGSPNAADLLVLLVITAGQTPADSTVNLMAPIVLHQPTRRAVQLVLGGTDFPVRARLLAG
jgi:flagellar assembly factor FliW